MKEKPCTFNPCGKIAIAVGLCSGHYYQRHKGKELTEILRGERVCDIEGCERPHKGLGLCTTHYKQKIAGKEISPVSDKSEPAQVRFDNRVRVTPYCWEWTGSLTKKGYGKIKISGKLVGAHRYSYTLYTGEDIAGKLLDHRCHNRSCVNPMHLRISDTKRNNENRSGAQRNSKTGVLGVCWIESKQRYVVQVGHNGGKVFGGYFRKGELDLAEVRAKELRLELFTDNDLDRR